MEDPTSQLTGQPTSEEECALIAKYTLMISNDMTFDETADQKRRIVEHYGLMDGCGISCGCIINLDRKCFDEKVCINMKETGSDTLRYSCPPSCGVVCCNNPFKEKGFAIDRNKLYLDWDKKKHFGLRAYSTIEKGEPIGEYRGKLVDSSVLFDDPVRSRYAFSIPFCNKSVDALEGGSAMRLINSGCSVNVDSVVYIHDYKFKIVFLAAKKIVAREELFIDYDYTFPPCAILPKCYCGIKKCRKEMGRHKSWYYEGSGLEMPKEIKLTVCGMELRLLLESKCRMEECNVGYKERHVHELLNTVAAVVLRQNDLVVVEGRIIGTIKTSDGFFFYTVKVPNDKVREYILPMWAAFKSKEMGEWVVRNVFSDEDRNNLIAFLGKCTSRRYLSHAKGEILGDYVRKILHGVVPSPSFMQTADLEGLPAVLGSTVMYKPTQAASAGPNSRKPIDLNVSPVIKTDVQKILEAVSTEKPNIMYQRLFENAAETLAILYVARLPDDRKIGFQEAYSKMSREIRPFYFDENAKRRKFLQFEHFRLAIDIEVPGSNSWKWCSLCKDESGFSSDTLLNDHYHKIHAICARGYACSKKGCKFTTRYPSEYRSHAYKCTSEYSELIGHDLDPEVIDSFADFLTLKPSSGTFTYPIRPGLPSFWGICGKKEQEKTNSIKTVVKMDLANCKPVDDAIACKPCKFKVMKKCQELSEKSKLNFQAKPRYVTRLHVKQSAIDDPSTSTSSQPPPPKQRRRNDAPPSSHSNV